MTKARSKTRDALDIVNAAMPTIDEQIEAVEGAVEGEESNRTPDGTWTDTRALWSWRCLRAALDTLKAAKKQKTRKAK